MAAPNYRGEKRRKDLAKQAKKKEKLARKQGRGGAGDDADDAKDTSGVDQSADAPKPADDV